MKKTLQVNIGGYAFNVDGESYNLLDTYLDSIKRYYQDNRDGKEIVDDIEERLGELLFERVGTDNVVSAADARYAIGILGSPSTFDASTGTAAQEKSTPKRLYRNPNGKMIGGVCSGFATYLNWDISLVRLILVLLFIATIATGYAILLMPLFYIVCWIAMPNADTVQKQYELRGEKCSAFDIEQQHAVAKPADNRPAGHILGRVLGVILGLMLFLSGLSAITGGIFALMTPALVNLNPDWAEAITEAFTEIGLTGLGSLGISTIIVACVAYFIPCIIAIYYGILLMFNLKSPKWRPGLILIGIWFISLMVLAVLVGIDIIKLIPSWS